MSTRTWFATLRTEERIGLSSIVDPAFLKLFLELSSKRDGAVVSLSLEEITTLYTQYSSDAVLTDSKATLSPHQSNPTSASANIDTTIEASMKSEIKTCTPIVEGKELLPLEKLPGLLNSLISHIYALLPAALSEVYEVEQYLQGGESKEKESNQKEDKKLTIDGQLQVGALALDPSILDVVKGSCPFYNFADKIVDLMNGDVDGKNDVNVSGKFLNDVPGSKSIWPNWLISIGDKNTDRSTFLGLILLAGIEMSIRASHQRSLEDFVANEHANRGDVMVHIGGESSLHTVWQLTHKNPSQSNATTQLVQKIGQIFRVRKMIIEDGGKKIRALVSPEEWGQFESNFQGMEGLSFKVENLLTIPIKWFMSSSGEVYQNCTTLMIKIWLQIINSISDGRQKNNHKYEGGNVEDSDIIGEVLPAPTKKKKKKHKKKGKKKVSSNEAKNQTDEQSAPVVQPISLAKTDALTTADNKKTEKFPATEAPVLVTESLAEDGKTNGCSNVSSIDTQPDEVEVHKPSLEEKTSDVESADSSLKTKTEQENKSIEDADESAWETVAAKTRKPKAKQSNEHTNNKSNAGGRSNQSGRNGNSASNGEGGNSNDRRKDKKRNRKERDRGKRNQTKVVKDMLAHILDAVDDELSRRGKQGGKSVTSDDRCRSSANDKRSSPLKNNNRNNNDERQKAAVTSAQSSLSGSKQQPRSLRDVVAGVTTSAPRNNMKPTDDTQSKAKPAVTEHQRDSKIKPGLSYKSVIEPTRQHTAVVIPSTMTEAKASEKAVNATEKKTVKHQRGASKSKKTITSIGGKPKVDSLDVEAEKDTSARADSCHSPPSTSEDDRNIPPLSTLLGPGTSCSATSSVASSLEAPHSSTFRHQSISTTEDVGVHLLNVCKQLSIEIDTFMSRRSLALDVRRKERSAVLGALQDTLLKIWPGNCHVEMYGSCATQLDLPSSDLDLVVCGLDEMMMNNIPMDTSSNTMTSPSNSILNSSPSTSVQNIQHQQSFDNTSQKLHQSFDNSIHTPTSSPGEITNQEQTSSSQEVNTPLVDSSPDEMSEFIPDGDGEMIYDASGEDRGMESYNPDYNGNQQEYYYVPYNYIPPMSLNAQRVIRLASELEMQPWAVQVKAIPTAAVPVVKILADPSKLPGAMGTGDSWMMQQHIAQAGTPSTPPISPEKISVGSQQFYPQNQSKSSHFFPQPSMPSWRGADILNGLQPVDITFEGPEHGGIGSTTYSSCVVRDACNATGLSPEKTPVVQVKMVLKELLAQRRLNEPFTGGLSSYALLLLLLAVVKERQIIQEEMARVEKQRQEVNQLNTSRESKLVQKQNNTETLSAAQIVAGKSYSSKPSKSKADDVSSTVHSSNKAGEVSEKKHIAPKPISKQASWASIAKKSNGSTARTDSMSTATISNSSSLVTKKNGNEKNKTIEPSNTDKEEQSSSKNNIVTPTFAQSGSTMNSGESESEPTQSKMASTLPQSKMTVDSQPRTAKDAGVNLKTPLIPQCSNDVLEVLCLGELTAGKLLMHFLLFYGQHFDAQTTLIDVNGTHHPEYGIADLLKLSPFVTRPPGGNIDPITGMYSVDPIVVYDPLEGAMDHNVAKRCYCWNKVKWVFAQSYMTVSSIVETSDTSSKTATKSHRREKMSDDSTKAKRSGGSEAVSHEQTGANTDIITPILELLLSF